MLQKSSVDFGLLDIMVEVFVLGYWDILHIIEITSKHTTNQKKKESFARILPYITKCFYQQECYMANAHLTRFTLKE
jgi:hypothetical protein